LEKEPLRREMAARRRRIPPAQAEAAAERCRELLLDLEWLARARRIALYAALPGEIPTRALFESLAARGCELLLPRTVGDRLEFAPAGRWSDLRPGRLGILEPAGAPATPLAEGDLVLVPGLAFDHQGWRLGRGGGYYDRALAAAGRARVVGLAYAFQLVDAVPHDSHDRPVDAIVTEEGCVRARGR